MKKHCAIGLLITYSIISTSWALPAPKYLSVPNWKDCVHTVTKGSAEFICLPLKRPDHCPDMSWRTLKDEHLIEKCL